MSLSSIERAVASHSGIAAEAVAIAVGCTLQQVYAARRRLHRNTADGLPGPDARASFEAPKPEHEDFGHMARTNRSVCG